MISAKINKTYKKTKFYNHLKSEKNNYFGEATELVTEYYESRPDAEKYDSNVQKSDIYIHPVLTQYDALSFGKGNCEDMIEIGERAASAKIK
ncbi:MAG: hypothetical protein K5685_15015 [Bacteroidales bacterium]|nr:hypothetical protein [Bacteroidales bacterium]